MRANINIYLITHPRTRPNTDCLRSVITAGIPPIIRQIAIPCQGLQAKCAKLNITNQLLCDITEDMIHSEM